MPAPLADLQRADVLTNKFRDVFEGLAVADRYASSRPVGQSEFHSRCHKIEDGRVDDSGEIIYLSASCPRVFRKTDVLFVPKSAASLT